MNRFRISIALAFALAAALVPTVGRATPPDFITVGGGAIRNPGGVYKSITMLATTQPRGEAEAPTDGSGYLELDGKRQLLDCVRIIEVTGGHELIASTAPNANGKFTYVVLFDRKFHWDYGVQGSSSVDAGGACKTSYTLPFTIATPKAYQVFGDGFRTRPYPHVTIPI